jgi:tetratricopeptide (TPR) repeat protein
MVAGAQVSASKAEIKDVEGKVEVKREGQVSWESAKNGRLLYAGDAVRTGDDGKAAILSNDESRIHLNHNSLLVIKEVASTAGWAKKIASKVRRSLYWLYNWKDEKPAEISFENNNVNIAIDLETVTVRAGIRGTSLILKVQPTIKSGKRSRDTSTVMVFEGKAQVQDLTGPRDSIEVKTGHQVVAEYKKPMRLERLTITPENAVQWTLYVPPEITGLGEPSSRAEPALAAAMQIVGEDIQGGNLTTAIDRLNQLTQAYPQEAAPYRLLAVALLALNQKEQALKAAQKAVNIAPNSPASAIVLSYVHQALFDLSQAKNETLRTLKLDPQNMLAFTNLARLRFGEDDIKGAWHTLEKARKLDPGSAEVYNLRGFVLLAQGKTDTALDEFEQAIKLNNRLSEPHLGLGLAYMRQGRTDEALKEMAVAVLLDPQRSLLHSYWGKMLHQIKRFDKALEVLERARQLDPRDPTPLFYKAIVLRDLYQPGKAVQAFNDAIALNDNRAVYRSRFLLDQDLAARNVNLANLYNQLGLTSWARNKALASVKNDYTNFDGHLFYAGSLLELEGRSYSFNSEALLSRLLQPANINTFNSFNNYTTLFEKPGVQGTIVGSLGNNETYGINGEASGALPQYNLALNLGGFYDDTDGWREDHFEHFRSAAGIAKWQPTRSDGIFAAASWTKLNQGDANYPRFEVDSPHRPDDRLEGEVQRLEFGYHRHLAPRSDLLVYFAHLENDTELLQREPAETTPPSSISIETERQIEAERPFYQGQLHYTFGAAAHQFLLGSLQYRGESRAQDRSAIILDDQRFPIRLLDNDNDLDIKFESYYLQDIWQVNRWLTVEGAAYYDRMQNANSIEGTDWIVEGFNPRLGVIVRPTAHDTLRLAAFRYILPFISSRLDPTDVAGIQIFRNTQEGSENSEIAFEWDHEWQSGFTNLSLFYLDKDYKEKIIIQPGQEVDRHLSGDVRGLELRYNQLLTDQVGLTGGYRYLKVDDEIDPLQDPLYNVNRDDHQFRVGLRYVRPDGIMAGIAQTYRYIDNDNIRSNDSIAITDLEFAYQFPNRLGIASFEVLNLFDNQFNWVTDRFVLKGRSPERQVLFTLSLNF